MFRRLPVAAAALLLAALPSAARATGAWTTYMRVFECTDMVALTDTVWIASREAGLLRHVRSTGAFESLTREPGGLASLHVTALEFDRTGRLWAGTPGRGASRLSADGSTWDLVNAFDGLPSDSVNTLRATGDSVWIGTQGGLALWDGEQVAGSVPDLGTASPFRSNSVRGVVVTGDTVMVGTGDGIYLARRSANLATWTNIDSGLVSRNVYSMATDGREVFALANGAAYRWNRATSRWNYQAVLGGARLLRDDAGWITASNSGGLWRWNGTGWAQLPGSPATSSSVSPGEVEFAADPAGATFAMRDGTLRVQGTPWTTLELPGPVDNNIQNVVVDGARVWVNSNSDGVSRLENGVFRSWRAGCCGSGQDTSFVNPAGAFAALRDGRGRMWFSFWGSAIERYDDSTGTPSVVRPILAGPPPLPDSLYNHTAGWAVAHDPENYVYIGGDTFNRGVRPPVGIDVFEPGGTLLTVWRTTNTGIPDNQVRALAVDRKRTPNRIWAGFPGTGVAYATIPADRTAAPQFSALPRTSTLDIFGLELYGDSLWVLSTTNLQRFSAATFSFAAEYEIPGAPAPLGAMRPLAVSPDGSVWVGSVDGVRRYRRGGGTDDYKTSNSPLANDEVRAIAVDPATGVAWFATAGGLSRFDPGWTPPPPPTIPSLAITVYPNPAQFPAIGLALKLSGNATAYTGEIYDLNGRAVHRFTAAGNGRVVWDGRDLDGRRVRPGVYFVRAHGGGHEARARVVVLR